MKKILALICIVVMAVCLAGCGKSIEEAKVGETVEFGKYRGNAIEWIVLKEERGKKLLLSKYILFEKAPFYTAYGDEERKLYASKIKTSADMKYPNSGINYYLNRKFIFECFSDKEEKQIVKTKIDTRMSDDEPKDDAWYKVFLPLPIEIDKEYICGKYNQKWASGFDWEIKYRTLEALRNKEKKRLTDEEKMVKDNWWYWTRNIIGGLGVIITPNGETDLALAVEHNSLKYSGIRPMMWVKAK